MSNQDQYLLPEFVQEALTRIGTLFDTLFHAAEDAIFLMDDMRFVDCNPATLRMFGCRVKEDIVGHTPTHFSPARQPDDRDSEERARALVTLALDGTPQHFEWRHCKLDRTEFDVEVRLNPFVVDGKRFLVAVVRDVTERKRAAEHLLEEKQFSERLIDCLPGIFYLYDSDLRLRRWNKNHEAMGYSAEEMRGKRLEEWFGTEAARRQVIATARAILERGGPTDFLETELLYKDGSLVPYLCSGVRIDSPAGPMLLGVGTNMAARVQAEKALAASERYVREVFDATNDALFVHDESGRVLDVNQRACAMFGLDREQALCSSFGALGSGEPPYSPSAAVDMIRRAIHEGPQVFEWQSRRGDGSLFWSEVALRAFRLEGQDRVIASVRDITERKRTTLERERLMTEVQTANIAKDRFLSVLSHELRNPLAPITLSLDILLHQTPGGAQAERAREVIRRQVGQLTRLIDDLLDVTRISRQKVQLRRQRLELCELLRCTIEDHRSLFEKEGVELEFEPAARPVSVNGDWDRLAQVFGNLLQNAAKFTGRGGRTKVSVSTDPATRRAVVRIADTGIGIAPELLDRLFSPFAQQEDAVLDRSKGGLGLGLALVKGLVELHGGEVAATSEGPGKGAEFTVQLPLELAGVEASRAERGRVAPASRRVLVIEDNVDAAETLRDALAFRGHEIEVAYDGPTGIMKARRFRPEVVFCDIGLPGMSGYEVARTLRSDQAMRNVFLVALTGYAQPDDVQQATEAGFDRHLAKPPRFQALEELLAQLP